MQLKEYQQRVLTEIRSYLEILADLKKKAEIPSRYVSRKNGLGQPLPTFRLIQVECAVMSKVT